MGDTSRSPGHLYRHEGGRHFLGGRGTAPQGQAERAGRFPWRQWRLCGGPAAGAAHGQLTQLRRAELFGDRPAHEHPFKVPHRRGDHRFLDVVSPDAREGVRAQVQSTYHVLHGERSHGEISVTDERHLREPHGMVGEPVCPDTREKLRQQEGPSLLGPRGPCRRRNAGERGPAVGRDVCREDGAAAGRHPEAEKLHDQGHPHGGPVRPDLTG